MAWRCAQNNRSPLSGAHLTPGGPDSRDLVFCEHHPHVRCADSADLLLQEHRGELPRGTDVLPTGSTDDPPRLNPIQWDDASRELTPPDPSRQPGIRRTVSDDSAPDASALDGTPDPLSALVRTGRARAHCAFTVRTAVLVQADERVVDGRRTAG